jgi:hypothetical protein
MAKDIQPGGFTLKFKDGQLSLHANSVGPTGNKKVPPGTLLQLIRAGAMKKEEVAGSEPYTLDPKKMVMIAGAQTGPDKLLIKGIDQALAKPLALAEVVTKLLIKGIDQAPDFVAPGQCPAKIIVGGPYWFVPQDLHARVTHIHFPERATSNVKPSKIDYIF